MEGSTGKQYDVELTDEGFECNCQGFAFHGYCKQCDRESTRSQWKRLASNPSKMWARLNSLTGTRKKKGELHKNHEIKFSKDDFKDWYKNIEKKCFYCEISLEDYLKIKHNYLIRLYLLEPQK